MKQLIYDLEHREKPREARGEGLAAEHQGHPHRGEEGKCLWSWN